MNRKRNRRDWSCSHDTADDHVLTLNPNNYRTHKPQAFKTWAIAAKPFCDLADSEIILSVILKLQPAEQADKGAGKDVASREEQIGLGLRATLPPFT